jgi:hypothetical protein
MIVSFRQPNVAFERFCREMRIGQEPDRRPLSLYCLLLSIRANAIATWYTFAKAELWEGPGAWSTHTDHPSPFS